MKDDQYFSSRYFFLQAGNCNAIRQSTFDLRNGRSYRDTSYLEDRDRGNATHLLVSTCYFGSFAFSSVRIRGEARVFSLLFSCFVFLLSKIKEKFFESGGS